MKLSNLMPGLCALWLAAGPVMAAPAEAPAMPATAASAPLVPDLVEEAARFGDFNEVERLYGIYGQPGLRSPLTGTPRILHFWMGIGKVTSSSLNVTEQYYVQLDALTRQWSKEHPQSVLAQLLYADSLMSHAWFHRGTDYANTVSPASWEAFGKYLNLSLDQLRRCQALAAKDSSWNALMLGLGRGLGWDAGRLMRIMEDGIAKNPDHDELYFTMLESLLPKWGGDLPSVEQFIASVTQRTRDKRGFEMYARLYAGLSYSQVKQSLFRDTRAAWPKMKQGFEDQLARYPHADHRNMYAYFACMAQDRPVLQEQLKLLGDGFNRIFWGDSPERTFEECKALAQQL